MTMGHLNKARHCVMELCESKCCLQIQIDEEDEALVVASVNGEEEVLPLNRFPERVVSSNQLLELDIPTFIRRQMD